jgi:regulator of sigma E protease
MLITILATIVVLGVLIFVHELGHFVTAKLADIEVPRFSIGLGPRLWGFRRGETEYVISWLPLGGYVKMAGMEELESVEGGPSRREEGTETAMIWDEGALASGEQPPRPRDFDSKSLPARAMVISAGVIMNMLFAFAVYAGVALVWGAERVPDGTIYRVEAELLPEGAEALAAIPPGARLVAIGERRIRDWSDLRRAIWLAPAGATVFHFDGAPAAAVRMPAADSSRFALYASMRPVIPSTLGAVTRGSAAERAGLRPGDRVTAVGGRPVATWYEVVEAIQASPGEAVDLEVNRDGARVAVSVVPSPDTVVIDGEPRVIGRMGVAQARDRPGPIGAVAFGATQTWEMTSVTLEFLRNLVTGKASPRSVGGPILIGQVSGRVARQGVEQFLSFMALFSINLAILNLLPIPVLDGGQLVFLGIEGVRGRALSIETRMRLAQVGLFMILAIMVWAFGSDLLRVFGI